MAKKNTKNKKLESIPKINKRLFRLWSEAVRERAGNKCEYCGIEKGELNENNVKVKIDAHHLLPRDVKDCPLKFDIMNGIALDPTHHKWGMPSFHRDPITTVTWLQKHFPDRYEYVLKYNQFTVDLQNRKVLEEIENRLKAKESLNLDRLIEIERENQRPSRSKKNPEFDGSLFDSEDSDESSESSQSSS